MSTIDKEALRWVMRQSERPLDDVERQAFDAWYEADIRHKGAFLRATAINHALDQATVQESLRPPRAQMDTEWAGASWKQPQRPARRAFLMYGGLAAGLAVLAAGTVYPPLSRKTVLTTALGEFRKVPLADRSVVTINGASQVEVDLGSTARRIALTRGEAWFEVAKDKSRPFIVAAGDARVRAVGTAFAVRRYDDGADVLVTEGTVEVWSEDGTAQKRLVTAGERAFVGARATRIDSSRQPDEIARRLAWREGKLVFMNQTLDEAVADFNRYSARKILVADPEIGHRTLVGQYQIDAPERFARDVSAFLDVPVAILPDRIVIGAARAPGTRRS